MKQGVAIKSKKCAVCSVEFAAKRITAKYCSQVCRDRSTNGARAVRNAEARSDVPRRRSGRHNRHKQNEIAPLLRVLGQGLEVSFEDCEDGTAYPRLSNHYPQWFDDYVLGACYVIMGSRSGKLDVSPGDIRKLCKLDEVSAKGVQSLIWNHEIEPVSKRHAQRLVQTTIIALNGIEMYLDRNPVLKSQLTQMSNAVASQYDRESVEIDCKFFAEWEALKANQVELASH